jgi:hypothetical protein
MGNGICFHAFLNMAQETGGQLHVPAILASDTELPLPTIRVGGWTPEQIWALLSRKQYLAFVGNLTQFLSRSARRLLKTPTQLNYPVILKVQSVK